MSEIIKIKSAKYDSKSKRNNIMHYRDLIITHKAFWNLERRAKYYDRYMKEAKTWNLWPEAVDLFEIEKLLKFIPQWDRWFRMRNPIKVFGVYQKILPSIIDLYKLRLETATFDEKVTEKIRDVFDELAPCSGEAYESTDCSKILHTVLPHLIVMWDIEIRRGILGEENRNKGKDYAQDFLPLMQTEAREAIAIYIDNHGGTPEVAVNRIRESCGYESLPKLVDEHNYVINTKHDHFETYLNELNRRGEIRKEDYQRLSAKLYRIG